MTQSAPQKYQITNWKASSKALKKNVDLYSSGLTKT